MSRFKTNSKNSKLVVLALIMALLAGGLAFTTNHNALQAAKKAAAQKASAKTHTITTKSGKKLTIPNYEKTPEEQAKVNEARLQKRTDLAVKQKRITETQAKLIKAKAAELIKAKSNTDPKARAKVQKDLYAWVKENNIPISFVFEMSRPRI